MPVQAIDLLRSTGPLTIQPLSRFSKILGKTGDFIKDIDILCDFYRQRMKDNPGNLRESMIGFWRQFEYRGLDPFEELGELIAMVGSKGSDQKKVINYFVGCLRGRLTNGPGSTGNEIDSQLIPAIEAKFGRRLTPDARSRIIALVTKYGPLKISSALLENNFNMEEFFLLWLEDLLYSKS